ncbi:MAG: hydroxyacylglutathione hydrolase [Gammaproteobacteria bacterium]|nr:hydroxyacylglutathione hydrolase [Gammaproteobacteria bacterium]
MNALEVHQIPCLTDNYGYLVHDPVSGETACIDTPDAQAILAALASRGWRLSEIWNTHHHPDHAGGNLAVKQATGCRIVAPAAEAARIAGVDRSVVEGEAVSLGEHRFTVLETPGHTSGHIVYWCEAQRLAFVGDTLFAMGCGRLFEGTPAQMWSSLQKLRRWPEDTLLYCAHEYTQSNARFALSVEPDNAVLQARAAEVDAARRRGEPTVPSRLGDELATNPFLRADVPAFRASLGMAEAAPVEVFARARAGKDAFRG